MRFRVVVGYEYPVEHKPPVKAEIILHGDRVVTDNIELLEQEPTTKKDLGVDCVARQDVERYIEGFVNEYTPKEELEFINLELDGLKHIPSVTPQEPKTGHWKPYLKEGLRYQCSACDSRFDTPWEYCPHCGAKMAESE